LERLKATFENIRVAVGGGLIKAFLFLEGTSTLWRLELWQYQAASSKLSRALAASPTSCG